MLFYALQAWTPNIAWVTIPWYLSSLKQELDDTIAKHELLEEEYVVAKAKLQMERDEMKADYDAMQVG